ncbi:MAG: pyridoxal-phosphate dependent enzyme [Xanthomonadaceae bacterium]|nr:pyridoxal-phosphate dependent enzyme [Xanthomonadaceae bacterium]
MDPSRTIPTLADVRDAAARISPLAHVTPVLRSRSLDALAGCALHFKCENLQRVGAFKFRGACNAVFALDMAQAARGVVTQSSGNHGAAIALACRLRDIPAYVVVPENAPQAKLAAMRQYGAHLHLCAPGMAARDAATARLQEETGAALVHPFNDARVIAGQGTATLELLAQAPALDALIAPVSGGGLLSGTAIAAQSLAPGIEVLGAEPSGAADAHESLRTGIRVVGRAADTLCDGLRAELGPLTFAILRERGCAVLLADDDDALAAMRLIFERLKLVVEPSAALALAVVLRHRERFAGRQVGIVLSGGNLDLGSLSDLR